MSGQTPYSTAPDHCFWSRAHDVEALSDVDPVVKGAFEITRRTKIATAGSCFAQHIAQRLKEDRFNFFLGEPPHPILTPSMAARYGYGVYSARYGNIYTARQLLQLVERAYGRFAPDEDVWVAQDGLAHRPVSPADPAGWLRNAGRIRRRARANVRRRQVDPARGGCLYLYLWFDGGLGIEARWRRFPPFVRALSAGNSTPDTTSSGTFPWRRSSPIFPLS